ncbi:hypothetical protein J3R83DRAFT_8341 [Lanmaoa asiatica]|nr:hypothetical protein J3R83DRAFT_8341 [Lanmaoa asiatica]
MLHTTSVRAARVLATPSAPQLRIIARRFLSSRAVRLCPPARSTVRVSSRCGISASFCTWAGYTIVSVKAGLLPQHHTPRPPTLQKSEAMQCLEQGTQKLEEGDVQGAKELYKRSVEIKRNASALFNLGVTHYHLKEFDDAISAWNESIALQPTSADTHTTASISPEDPEIAFNLAAVLEATGQLEEALEYYKRSKENGVDRAAMHIRNVSAKILGKQMQAAEAEDKSEKSDS